MGMYNGGTVGVPYRYFDIGAQTSECWGSRLADRLPNRPSEPNRRFSEGPRGERVDPLPENKHSPWARKVTGFEAFGRGGFERPRFSRLGGVSRKMDER